MFWAEKYRPEKFENIKGQEEAVEKIINFIKNFKPGKATMKSKKAMVLYGPPGVGKTTLAHVISKETDTEIFELNASDLRSKNKLYEILRPAIQQKSLTKERKIILIDEVDGISAVDYGGLNELLFLIEFTPFPVIMTANDVWDRKFSQLRKKCDLVRLKEVNYKTIRAILIDILRKEGKFVDLEVLTKISIKAKGDIRAAINDVQTESGLVDFRGEIGERNKEIDIFNVLRNIFKDKAQNELLTLFDSLNMPMDEIILWVEKNIPLEYHGEELARAFDLLSKVDVFRGRIYKQQYWRFLVYENAFLSYGISSAKKKVKVGFTGYQKPDRILKIWMNNQRDLKKKSIAKKYSKLTHVGEKRVMNEFPMIKSILRNPKVQKELRLNEEEITYLQE